MDPLTIAGAVSAAREALASTGSVRNQFKKLRGDFGVFWKHFERRVSNQPHDVPWDQLEAYRLNPEFIGRVTVGMARWHLAVKSELEEMFQRDLNPISGGRFETKGKLAAHLIDAVLESANEAAVELGRESRQILGAVDSGNEALANQMSSVIRAVDEGRAEQAEGVAAIRRDIERSASGSTTDTETQARETAAGQSPSTQPIPSLAQGGDPDKSPDDLVAELAPEDTEGAERLRELLDQDGALAVVVYIRRREGPEDGDSLSFLVTTARIAVQAGAFAEAEEAYVWASQLEGLDDHTRARQLVRAASMAQLHSGEERFSQLLEEARALAPDHPGLAIAEARTRRDGQWVLDRLADVTPENDHERALLHVTRAQGRLALGDGDGAAEELDKAQSADSANTSLREFASILPVVVAQRQVARGAQVDREALTRAAEGFQSLRSSLEPQARWDESAQLAARAAEAYALAEEFAEAEGVLGSVKRPEHLGFEARSDLGRAALITRRPELVFDFINESDTQPEARLLRADAQVIGEDEDLRRLAVETLTELLDEEDDEVRRMAAFALLAAAAMEEDVDWNEDAAAILGAVHPVNVAVFRAEHLRLQGEPEEAENVLLPHASQTQVLRLLRDYAAQSSNWDKAQDRSRSLMREQPSARDRLTNAVIVRGADGDGPAKAEFLAVARDESVQDDLRNRAFGAVMEMVGENRNYTTIRELAQEWHDEIPRSLDATWNLAFALARLAEHREAYGLVSDNALEAQTLQQARLLAEILYRGAPKDEAVRRLEELSTQFGRQEEMEALLVMTFLDAEQDGVQLDDALTGEVGERFRSFPDRFPNSKVLWRIEAPETGEEWHELLAEMHADSALAQQDVRERITRGEAPVNALVVVSPVNEVGSAWARRDTLPMGFAIPIVDAHERAIAVEAIGGAAIWDPSSVFTAGGLGRTLEDKIKAALPGSSIVNETLDDADSAVTGPSRRGRNTTEVGYDPDAERPFVEHIAADEVERQDLRAQGMLRLAKELDPQPAAGEGVDQELLDLLNDQEGPRAWKPFLGTVMLAQRTKRPIFSDDRWIRQFAHEHGIKAFGSLALLDALRDRGMITAEERTRARLRLAASQAWGVDLTTSEMVEAARSVDWGISKVLEGAFRDRAVWRSRPGDRIQELVAFLQVAYDEAPETLGKWLQRMIEVGTEIAPHLGPSWWSHSVLVLAWGVDQSTPAMSDQAFRALVDETKALPLHLKTLGVDPVLGAMGEVLGYFESDSVAVRSAVLRRLLKRLGAPDQLRAFLHFVGK